MTLIEKKLLISDLCARLPYGVKVDCTDGVVQLESVDFELGSDKPVFWHGGHGTNLTIEDDNIKPYLIPLSKMTEEQRLELEIITDETIGIDTYSIHDFTGYSEISLSRTLEIIQWCYGNHLDINGLIPMGLAIDATDKNIYNH
jgi:hypothetical protein